MWIWSQDLPEDISDFSAMFKASACSWQLHDEWPKNIRALFSCRIFIAWLRQNQLSFVSTADTKVPNGRVNALPAGSGILLWKRLSRRGKILHLPAGKK